MKFIRVFPVAIAAAALLSACGDDSAAGSTTAATMGPTSFATLAPTLSTVPPTTLDPTVPGQVTTEVTEYTIQAGDVPINVAKKFSIPLEALANANVDTAGYGAFFEGLKIKIPAGAILPGSDPATPTTTGTTVAPQTTLNPPTGCTVGSHTIKEGDLPGTVAKLFDLTVAQLDAANVNTQGYKNFIVGVKIIIPCADN